MNDYEKMTAAEQEQHRQEKYQLLLEELKRREAAEQQKPPFVRFLRRVWQRISTRIEFFIFELRLKVDKQLREEIESCRKDVEQETKEK